MFTRNINKPNRRTYPPSQHNILTSNVTRNDSHERGAAILILQNLFHKKINLTTNLQAVAAKIMIGKLYTICSIYIPHLPIDNLKRDLCNLIDQLPQPFMLVGDMNARSPMWGDLGINSPNPRGSIFEELLIERPISIINNGSPTHFHIQTNTSTVIDLTMCSSDCIPDFSYSIHDNLNGSDHFPIIITIDEVDTSIWDKPDNYNIKKANWTKFDELTSKIDMLQNIEDINELTDGITNLLTLSADQAIPRKPTSFPYPPIPWNNDNLKLLKTARNRAERSLRNNPIIENRIAYKRRRTRFQFHTKLARSENWKKFLTSINQHTSLHKIWNKVQKISGKYRKTPNPTLKDDDGNLISDPKSVADTLASTFAQVSADQSYSEIFLRHKNTRETIPILFNTEANFDYNKPFTKKEFDDALSTTAETAPGNDNLPYSIIKHANTEMKKIILKSFNIIYQSNQFPRSWSLAIIIPILKPQKTPTDPNNYRPISLTICMCKLLEKIVNRRLIWFLEKNNLIDVQQCGFRRNRSTTDNLIEIDSAINSARNNRNHFIGVFF